MRRDWIAPVAITALAAAVRFTGLGDQCFWGDEVCSIEVARYNVVTSIMYYASDPHPPLFYMCLRIWRLFGESEAHLRTLPALLGALAIPTLYAAVSRLHGKLAATTAAMALALNPLHVWVSQDLRNLSMLAFFCLLSVALFVPMATGERDKLRWSHVLATAAALYTNYFAFFILAFEGIYLLWRRRSGRALKHIAVPALLFAPWVLFLLAQLHHGQPWRQYTPLRSMALQTWLAWSINAFPWRASTLIPQLDEIFVRDPGGFKYIQIAITVPSMVLVAAAFLTPMRKSGKPFAALLAVPTLLVLATCAFVPLFSPKYMVFVAPAFAACVGIGFAVLWPKSKLLAVVCLGLTLATFVLSIRQVRSEPLYMKPPWRQVFASLEPQLGPDDILLVYSKETVPDLMYYYNCSAEVAQILPPGQIALSASPEKVAAQLARLTAGRRTVWLARCLYWLHDPDGIVYRTLNETLIPEETVEVQPMMEISLAPFRTPDQPRPATSADGGTNAP